MCHSHSLKPQFIPSNKVPAVQNCDTTDSDSVVACRSTVSLQLPPAPLENQSFVRRTTTGEPATDTSVKTKQELAVDRQWIYE